MAFKTGGSVGLIAVGALAGVAALVGSHRSTPFDALFRREGERADIDPDLLRAIAKVESDFNPRAIGKNPPPTPWDYGLMQVNGATANSLGVTDPDRLLDPDLNVNTASRLIVALRRELGDKLTLNTLIAAYNAGSPAILRRGVFNVGYVASVRYHLDLYKLGGVA